MKFSFDEIKANKINLLYLISLIAVAVITFYFAIQSNSAGNFYEFDPYMYMEITRILAIHGSIPITGLAYPCGASCSSNRFGVIVPYWLAGYKLAMPSVPLYQIANLYPPIMLIIMALLLYALFNTKPAKATAVILLLSMPVVFQQFTGGMFQEEAIGFLSVIAVFVATYFALSKRELAYSVFLGVIFLGSLLGSKYFTVTGTILPAILGLYVIYLFAIKNKEELKHSIKVQSILLAFALIGNISLLAYHGGFALVGFTLHGLFIPFNLLALAVIYALSLLFYYSIGEGKLNKRHLEVGVAVIIILLLVFAGKIIKVINYLASYQHIQNTIPLFRTVQEFLPYQSELPLLGIVLGNIASVVLVLITLAIVLIAEIYYKYKRKESILLEIMLIATVYPLAYVGFGVGKYVADLGLVLVLAIAYLVDKLFEVVM